MHMARDELSLGWIWRTAVEASAGRSRSQVRNKAEIVSASRAGGSAALYLQGLGHAVKVGCCERVFEIEFASAPMPVGLFGWQTSAPVPMPVCEIGSLAA